MRKPWINMVAFPESALASQQETLEDAGREYSAWMGKTGQTKMIFHPCSNSNGLKGLESEGIGHAWQEACYWGTFTPSRLCDDGHNLHVCIVGYWGNTCLKSFVVILLQMLLLLRNHWFWTGGKRIWCIHDIQCIYYTVGWYTYYIITGYIFSFWKFHIHISVEMLISYL